jgi:hypothetical protein
MGAFIAEGTATCRPVDARPDFVAARARRSLEARKKRSSLTLKKAPAKGTGATPRSQTGDAGHRKGQRPTSCC